MTWLGWSNFLRKICIWLIKIIDCPFKWIYCTFVNRTKRRKPVKIREVQDIFGHNPITQTPKNQNTTQSRIRFSRHKKAHCSRTAYSKPLAGCSPPWLFEFYIHFVVPPFVMQRVAVNVCITVFKENSTVCYAGGKRLDGARYIHIYPIRGRAFRPLAYPAWAL